MIDLEDQYFGDVGFLYPYDIRYDAQDRAFCDRLPDGRVRFRLQTPTDFTRAVVVVNDGIARGAEMERYAADRRFAYWEALVQPALNELVYSFALKAADGRSVYWCKHGIDHNVEVLDRWHLNVDDLPVFETPAWAQGAVIYQIFPERFANGDEGNDPVGTVPWGSPPAWLEFQGGDLRGVTEKLAYLHDLGAEVIYLNPIFASPSTHKYDCVDYYQVDPAFGGNDALRELVTAAHARGMRVILDASFNHCHPRFFAFQDLVKNGENSPYKEWFTVREWPVRVRYRPHLVEQARAGGRELYLRYLETFSQVSGVELETVTGEGALVEPTYLAWYGVLDMPKINLSNPDARAYFLDVTRYWLREFDIDGWRMDVARHIVPDFWDEFRRAAKEVKPDAYLLAEIWGNTSPWLQGNQFDGTMNYFFRDLAVDYFAAQRMDTPAFLDGITAMLSLYAPQVMAVCQNLFSSHDVPRLLYEAGGDLARLRLGLFFLLTMPGAAGIYYGDEIGMNGGQDPHNRGAFPWDKPETWDGATLEMTRALIRLRKEHPALRTGDWRLVWQGEDAFAYERVMDDERVVVILNRGAEIKDLRVPVLAAQAELLWGKATLTAAGKELRLSGVGAQAGVILRAVSLDHGAAE